MAATSTPAHTYTVNLLPKRDEMYRKVYHLRWEGKENVLFSQEPGHAEQRQRWPLRWPDKQLLWWGALDWTRSNVCTFISCHGALWLAPAEVPQSGLVPVLSLSVLLSWINSSALIHIRDIWKTVFRDASRHSNTCARALFPVADSCSSASVPSTFYLASVLGLISLIWLSSEYLEEWDSSVSEKLWSRKQAELLWWPFYWQPKSNNPQIIANLERSGEVKKSLSLRVVALWFSPPTIWIGSVMCLIWSKIFSSALKLENFMDAWCVTDLISFHPSPWTGTDATTSQRLSPSIWHLGVRAVAGSKC